MVGEIRDLETANAAINAALTGHLVFSTLHTNSALEAIARLINLGVKPYLLAPALNLIIGQRLVRRLADDKIKADTTAVDPGLDQASSYVQQYFPQLLPSPSQISLPNPDGEGYL